MSDCDIVKKQGERESLDLFLAEYELVTECRFGDCQHSERPDFICIDDSTGERIGIELVRVMVDPETRVWRRIVDREIYMEPDDTALRLQEIVYEKERKRTAPDWQHPDRTILVLLLQDAILEDVAKFLDEQCLDEVSSTGFLEIWIADETLTEAYDTVQLFGIKPLEWRGLHPYHSHTWKPYG